MREKGSVTQCVGKRRHKTGEEAEEVAKLMATKYAKPFRWYYCGICNGYHVTSKPK